jgi:hypothetical protein
MKEFVSRYVKIVYDDNNRVVTKKGFMLEQDENFVIIRNEQNVVEAISINKIIRMEVISDGE